MSGRAPVLVSACLLGTACRYDGASRPSQWAIDNTRGKVVVPVCPEQLGGLPTPRPPAYILNGNGFDVLEGKTKVMDKSGADVTEAFLRGSEETIKIVRLLGIRTCIMKSRSPSCGVHMVTGVTTAGLLLAGLEVAEAG